MPNTDHRDVLARAQGHWPRVLADLGGIDPRYLTRRHGPCPLCGGTDRYRFDDRDGGGTWFCNQCGGRDGSGGAGDGLALLMRATRWSFGRAIDELAQYLVIPRDPPPRKPPHRAPNTQRYALELWVRAEVRADQVAAHPYARAKGITWAAGAGRAIASGRLIGRGSDCIVVPLRDIATDAVLGVQCINARGAKQSFGPIKGHGLPLGPLTRRSVPWYVTEGWADAVSIAFHHHGGEAVGVAAFGLSNQDAVAARIAQRFGPERIIILRDAA